MTHLVLHKVRGEMVYDVAQELQIGDELGWVIPTSGHRCYPYKTWPLDELGFGAPSIVPAGLPDHYEVDKGEAPKSDFNIMKMISPLMTKIKRRL